MLYYAAGTECGLFEKGEGEGGGSCMSGLVLIMNGYLADRSVVRGSSGVVGVRWLAN